MQTRRLGYTDLEFTAIGLGTWAIGGGGWLYGWGEQDDDLSIQTIHKGIDLGINWIDTAPVYGFGHSESVVGKAIIGLSSKPLIATKCCRLWDENGNIYGSLRKKSIQKEVDDSLMRLGIDVIDLYQIHWPHPKEEIEEGWDTIAGLKKEGKIRYAGVSNFSPNEMERILPIHPIASCQPPYSMIRRYIEEDVLPFCQENNIGVIPYSPMQKGLLTGKITKEHIAALPQDDHRRNDPMFQEPEIDHNIELANKLSSLAEEYGKTAAQLAVAWVLRSPEVTSAIVGSRRPDQIEETVQAGDWDLSDLDIQQIETWLSERQDALRAQ